ncbi:Transketolase, C-terminal section [hydrothermal vent metagenome]|uniref:Transketolase, C-terminal section n=1 Tax=hydrothermal vent metagenome TaxID=652676 RepID=A0A3B1DTD4_9ZZZZ
MSDKIATRDGFGKELAELGKKNKKIVMVSADLEDATRAEYFRDACPDRFFSVGIAEQDMVGMAAGLALQGYVAFVNSFAVFLTNRAYDMLRMNVCYNNTNVKVVCSHAGVTVGPDGASAQCLEDFALMRILPNMKVICPVDAIEARKATRAFADEFGPMYMRTSRAPLPVVTQEDDVFEIGKANVLREGKDVTVIGCGVMVSEALSAAEILKQEGVDVRIVNMHTIKPIDTQCIIDAAKETGAIVTAEEHQVFGGLGSAVAEVVVQNIPVPMEIVGVHDSFGQTGTPEELLKEYNLKDVNIVKAIRKVLAKKGSAVNV